MSYVRMNEIQQFKTPDKQSSVVPYVRRKEKIGSNYRQSVSPLHKMVFLMDPNA